MSLPWVEISLHHQSSRLDSKRFICIIMHFFIYLHKKLQINLFANFGFFKTANKFICKDNIFATIYSSFKEYQRLYKYKFLQYNLNCTMARPFWLIYPQNLNSHGQLFFGKYNTLESRYNNPLTLWVPGGSFSPAGH